ncbi:MAG TPA: hypothetical protein VF171_03275, partial [Trueperaceae bacterium]
MTSDLSQAETLHDYAARARHYREDDQHIDAAFDTKEDALGMWQVLQGFGATADLYEAQAYDAEPERFDWQSDDGTYLLLERKLAE